jgi:hypothetical protein
MSFKSRTPSGFAKAIPVPTALSKFLKLADGVELPKSEVAKQIYSYCREQNLRDKDDRRIIHPDAPLQKLFSLAKSEPLDFKTFEKLLSDHYYSNDIVDQDWIEDEINMSTEQELLAQIEALRKKAKDMEDQNKDTEFNKQRNFLINTVRDFLGIEVSDEEVCAVLYRVYGNHINNPHVHIPILYYLKKGDENMLLERKVFNRYARYHEIRYEDSLEIIINFVNGIKSKDQVNQTSNISPLKKRATPKGARSFENSPGYKPLFC